jgi:hypothetical protein
MKICQENPNFLKLGKNIGCFTGGRKCVLLLAAALNCHKSALFE